MKEILSKEDLIFLYKRLQIVIDENFVITRTLSEIQSRIGTELEPEDFK